MQTEVSRQHRQWAVTVTMAVLVVALAAGYGAATMSRASMSRGAATAATPAQQASSRTEGVIEVLEGRDGLWRGRVAEKAGQTYRRTDETLTFRVPEATPFVMGVAGDLHVGAIVHVRGAPGNGALVADRIVILTPNVKLE